MNLYKLIRFLKSVAFASGALLVFEIGLRVFVGRSLNALPLYMQGVAGFFVAFAAYFVNWWLARRAERGGPDA